MSHKLIKSTKTTDNDLGHIKVKTLLDELSTNNISIAQVTIDGKNKKCIKKVSDSYYYVLEGSGTFTIDDEEVEVVKGDLMYIPKGTPYFDLGKLTLLIIDIPRFDISQVEFLD